MVIDISSDVYHRNHGNKDYQPIKGKVNSCYQGNKNNQPIEENDNNRFHGEENNQPIAENDYSCIHGDENNPPIALYVLCVVSEAGINCSSRRERHLTPKNYGPMP